MNTKQIHLGEDFGAELSEARVLSFEGGAWLTWVKQRLEALRRMHQRRQAIGELARMSDSRLQDLGIPRDRIAEIVDGLIAREGPGHGPSANQPGWR